MPADADPGSQTPSGGGTEPGAASSASDMVGTVLAGRYRILRKLGEGAMGAVYLAEHIRIGRQDAIKVLRGPMAHDAEAIARFTRGARNVSAIRHPNVCAIYDFSDTSDGLQFMAMEYVPGATLKDILDTEGALPAERVGWIAKQVADALQAAHEVDIVHRDLKPGNIMVAQGPDGRDRVKVVDFDIAKGPRDGESAEEVTRLGFVVGTPEYMSPEQLMGERLDGRSDVYSLALVVFRALTGSLPFRADNVQDLALKRLTDTPLRLDEVKPDHAYPPRLQTVLTRGLQRRPADRYQSAAEFGHDIFEAVNTPAAQGGARSTGASMPNAGAELPATRVAEATRAPTPAPTPFLRSRRGLMAGGAAAVVVVAVVGIALLGHGGHPTPPEATQSPAGQVAQSPGAAAPASSQQSAAGSGAAPQSAGAEAQVSGAPTQSATSATTQAGAGGAAPSRPSTNQGASRPVSRSPSPSRPAPRTGTSSSGAGSRSPSSRIVVSPADAKAVLGRQMDAISLAPAPLSGAALQAIGDTARAVWNGTSMAAADRAFAAYIMGNVLVGLGDTTRAVQWLQRAVSLRPGERGYRQMLDAFRKPRP